MPKVNTEGTLKIFVKKSFDKDGETIEYNTAYFLCEDEDGVASVVQVNTKQDLASRIDEHGKISLQVKPDGKLSLIKFT